MNLLQISRADGTEKILSDQAEVKGKIGIMARTNNTLRSYILMQLSRGDSVLTISYIYRKA